MYRMLELKMEKMIQCYKNSIIRSFIVYTKETKESTICDMQRRDQKCTYNFCWETLWLENISVKLQNNINIFLTDVG
jgi:hypothetical protein